MKKILRLIINYFINPYTELNYVFNFIKGILLSFKSDKVEIAGTGVFLIFLKDKIIKIPLGEFPEVSLNKEFNNYLLLKQDVKLNQLVDYNLQKENDYYEMELLENIESNFDISYIIDKFETYKLNKKYSKKIDLSLNNLNKWCNRNFKYQFECKQKVMHGDLTPKNIMKNKNGRIVLIDLSRFSFNGIRGLDGLHYRIEKECKEKNYDFFDWIKMNLEQFTDKKLLFIYFVYRTNIENFYKVVLPNTYYKKSCEVYNKFINELERK